MREIRPADIYCLISMCTVKYFWLISADNGHCTEMALLNKIRVSSYLKWVRLVRVRNKIKTQTQNPPRETTTRRVECGEVGGGTTVSLG